MTVRAAVAADAAALECLEKRLFSEANYPLSRRAFYYHIRHSLLLVAQSETGEIAGYILALVRRREPKLYSLGIAPEYRGRGIASLLLEQMFTGLSRRGFAHMLLEVRCDNHAAIALYRRFGFETLKTLKAFYRDGCDACLMRR
ncbi:ribosomal protein S18-alanine N-acetyltransferase [Sulfurimonas sp. HSL-1656]|uniref:ribosomal protein S18-alanine N-acetyltransferase n=1 Tax=Thiomicrolovo subterrani TaxID=3131934 RepID=UPI0031F88C9E